MNALDRLFLRLYAANLRRPWRNEARPAWNDALYAVTAVVAVPAVAFVASLWLIARDVLPNYVGRIGEAQEAGAAVAVAISFGTYFALLVRFSAFRHRTKSEILSESPPRSWPFLGAWAIAIVSIALFFLIAQLIHITL